MSSESRYRQILKTTTLFGGVQIVNMGTTIIRAKFVAILIGPIGIGISSLFSTTIALISSIAGMGLNYSAVRDIAKSNEDKAQLSKIVQIFKRLLWIGSLIGAIFIIIFANILSKTVFGNSDHKWSFILLSLMLVFNLFTNGNITILEATRSIKFTAKSTILGSCLGLLTSIPLLYYFGIKGIVPSLIISSFTAYVISVYFIRKIQLQPVTISTSETISKGTEMVKLGLMMVFSQIIGSAVIYIINIYIRHKGGLADIGLYQAATSITNQSIVLVFSAMTADYYPRLAESIDNKVKSTELVNQQAIVTTIISTPILISLILFAPLFIKILLSNSFYSIIEVVRYLAFGSIFMAPLVVMGFISLAKGDKKTFFLYGSLYNNVLALVLYTFGYMLYGLKGMSIGFVINQFLYFFIMRLKNYRTYSFKFGNEFDLIFMYCLMFAILSLLNTFLFNGIIFYIIGVVILATSMYFSFLKIEKYMNIMEHIKSRIKFNK